MVRNLVVLGGSAHPSLTRKICDYLDISPAEVLLGKFAVGETRVEIKDSVRGKEVYIIQAAGENIDDSLVELLITISACKIASAKRVTAVLPLFPYSKQADNCYERSDSPLGKAPKGVEMTDSITLECDLQNTSISPASSRTSLDAEGDVDESDSSDSASASPVLRGMSTSTRGSASPRQSAAALHPGYKQWQAKPGTLVANLLTCAGADHIITMDLHDSQYQGFFNIPVDNLTAKSLIKRHIRYQLPEFSSTIIVSPDAGGAKRATAIADELSLDFALIHKVASSISREENPTIAKDGMILVGDVRGRTAVLIDDLADTCETLTRAARLLKNKGAKNVYAFVTHGVFGGEAVEKIDASAVDKVFVTNSVPQEQHLQRCNKLEVLDISTLLAETIRRIYYGESVSALFSRSL
ncbi:ribose-phosphate pyrophosphokinase [Xylona heveae TC161]|uniref:ribose-phosphate diphosphokinase n=1 Tax=Xylona heveae (strain CBS 132557 / TC161) TaxID=1328760 RepID=A0A165HQ76_XYLHT|nr:ribose-phosphate pyrophosphokinase [Xylona heveae TC161]KZF23825.1 ribose-phosphate pyrophosphokinase [Xylona heveae TC161]